MTQASPFAHLLDNILDFVEQDGIEKDDLVTIDKNKMRQSHPIPTAEGASIPPAIGGIVEEKKREVRQALHACEREMKPLDEKLKKINAVIKRATTYIKTLTNKATEMKQGRKRAGEGIESQMFKVLMNQYGIKLQAYHGGSLTGKDIQKVMSNAGQIFAVFAGILKENAKDDCKLSKDQIDDLCKRFGAVFVLWDGAFSLASKIDPTADDVEMYLRFVKAAVHSHVAIGCNIMPKVHLMWIHVKGQMIVIAGGLGKKREDWLENYIS